MKHWRSLGSLAVLLLLLVWALFYMLFYGQASHIEEKPGQVTLQLWTIALRPKSDEYMLGQLAAFEAAHPGVKVEWLDMPQSAIMQKLMATVAGGVAPDVVNLTTSTALTLARDGALCNISALTDPSVAELYFPNLWHAPELRGQVYALPWYVSTRVLMINRNLLAQAGLDPEMPVENWDDIVRLSEAVRSKTGSYGYEPVVRLLDDWGMDGLSFCESESGRAVFAQPENLEAASRRLSWYCDLYRRDLIPKECLIEGYTGAIDRYKAGTLAVLEAGPQMLLRIEADAPKVYAATRLVLFPKGRSGHIPASLMNLVVPAPSRHKEQAVDLALWLTSPQAQLQFDKLVPLLPSTVATARDPYFTEEVSVVTGKPSAAQEDALQRQAVRLSMRQLPYALDFSLGLPHNNDLERAIKEAVESAMYGKMSVAESLREAQRVWNGILGLEDQDPAISASGDGKRGL